jgi:hypothetical protein
VLLCGAAALWPAVATAQAAGASPTATLTAADHAAMDAATDSLMFRPVEKSPLLAVVQTTGVNALVWSFNRFLRESGENPGFRIGLNSWENNWKNGFEWDDNSFMTNQFAHPYHGSLYFNSARSNGYDFWASTGFAFAGSFQWEYFGETHHASYNDWISTSVGGAALGEVLHRMSSMVLDNTKTGSARFWNELGGLLIDPMRGVSRLVTGRSSERSGNDPDRYPSKLRAGYEVGARTLSETRIGAADTTRLYMRAEFAYGDPFAGDIEKPFDTFDFAMQLNFDDVSAIGQVDAKGLLFATELAESENSRHLLGAYQHYEYVNNSAYEFGGQSLSASYLSYIRAGTTALRTELHLTGLIMGGTKSDYENFTGRSYDYGPGVGFKLKAVLTRNERPFLTVGHANHWLYVVNGNRAEHFVAFTFARLDLQYRNRFGLGLEYDLYNAERSYADFPDVSQRNPEIRTYLSWVVD